MKRITDNTLLHTLADYLPEDPIIIEAGAFKGKDTIRMAKQWPHGNIYAFEPVKELFDELQANCAPYTNIRCINLALADKVGECTFWPSEHPRRPGKASQAGSLLAPKERLKLSPITFGQATTVQSTTLDVWAKEEGIDHIDLLWLDLQGYELPVMQASPHLLKKTQCIWTEVHFTQAYEGQAQYQEVQQWLEMQGYTIAGKDFDEPPAWFFGNILAVRQ